MTAPWIAAFAALWAVTLLQLLVTLGIVRNATVQLRRVADADPLDHLTVAVRQARGRRVGSFRVKDAQHQQLESNLLLGRPAIYVFLDSACEPCRRLTANLEASSVSTPEVPLKSTTLIQEVGAAPRAAPTSFVSMPAIRLLPAAALPVGLMLFAWPASAGFPGRNGLIAFTRFERSGKTEIYEVSPRGGVPRLVVGQPNSPSDLHWAPDGRRFAFVTLDGHGVQRLVIADAGGAARKVLIKEPSPRGVISGMCWSPGDRRIAFSITNPTTNRSELYAIGVRGGDRRSLGAGGQPAMSPDGRKIAFIAGAGNAADVWVMNADGSGRHRLTRNPANDTEPDWSPDGKRIVFVSERDGNWEIYVMNADGSDQTRLTHNPAYDLTPVWSPDGRKIAFSSRRVYHQFDIFVMNADGTDQMRLTRSLDDEQSPSWQPLPRR